MLYIRKERGYPIDASERWKCCWDQTLLYKPLVGKGLQWQIAWLVSQIIMLPSPGLFPILFYRTQQIQIDYNNKKGLCLSWIRRHFNVWYHSLYLTWSLLFSYYAFFLFRHVQQYSFKNKPTCFSFPTRQTNSETSFQLAIAMQSLWYTLFPPPTLLIGIAKL